MAEEACVALGLSLLQFEIGYPLALLVTPLVALKRRRPHLYLWTYAWLGTVAVLAIRTLEWNPSTILGRGRL